MTRSRLDPDPPPRAGAGGQEAGTAEIDFARRDGRTRLARLYHRAPLRVLFPRAEAGEPLLAAVATVSGGLVGGDRIAVAVRVGERASAHVTAAAAEKVYRSPGAITTARLDLSVGNGGWLEFLPPETILFEGARLSRETVIELAPGAGFLGGGMLVFGRRARGERYTRGFLREAIEISRGGQLVWGDALCLDGEVGEIIDDPGCLAGAAATATLILAPPRGDPAAFLDAARRVQDRAGLPGGITAVGGLVIARWLAADAAQLRRAFADLACHLRAAAMGLPPRLPRLWHV